MRYAVASILAIVLIVWLEPAPPTQTTKFIQAPKPVVPVSVDHPRPAIIEHVSDLRELQSVVLHIEEYEQPRALAVARAEYEPPAPTAPILRVQLRPSNILAPDYLRVLVEQYFQPADVDRALLVAWCESRWDASPKNPNSTASGLFQHLRGWWSGDWGVTGPFDPFDPESSVKAAAALVYGTVSGWGNWYPSKFCWQP